MTIVKEGWQDYLWFMIACSAFGVLVGLCCTVVLLREWALRTQSTQIAPASDSDDEPLASRDKREGELRKRAVPDRWGAIGPSAAQPN